MGERKLDRKELLKKAGVGTAALASLPALAGTALAAGGARNVRWDIISLAFTTPLTVNPGGFSEAKTPIPDDETIRLTGAGTFVAPAGHNGGSNAVTGGGSWATSTGGSGSYEVKELVTFEFANFQSPGLNDNIGDTNERANGTAVLRIEYSDGQRGVLVVGCHGPGAPPGIFEGIAVTKGFKTYDRVQGPPAGQVDANRTIFHVAG